MSNKIMNKSKTLSIQHIYDLFDIDTVEIKKNKLPDFDNYIIIDKTVNINGLGKLKLCIFKLYIYDLISCKIEYDYYFFIIDHTRKVTNVNDLIASTNNLLTLAISSKNMFGYEYHLTYTEKIVKSNQDNLVFMCSQIANNLGYFYDEELDDYIKR